MVKSISIKDVAVLAGTSIATVSRILNDSGYPVSQTLRARVENAIRTLGYRPNRMAQNLRSKQAMSIGLIIRDIGDSHFGAIAQGATEEATRRGLMPLICSSKRNPKLELDYLQMLAQHQVAGIVLAGASWEEEHFRRRMAECVDSLSGQGIRVVSCAPQAVTMPCVRVDNRALGADACRLLCSRGHTVLGMLCGEAGNLSTGLRLAGFSEEALAANASLYTVTGAFSWEHGHAGTRKLMEQHPDITALFAATDILAVGALRALQDMGRAVPDDVSVLGVGDVMVARYTRPALSTFGLPLYELGAASVKLVCDPATTQDTVVNLPYSYINRESVGVRR